jgi:hypothetical protein
MLLVPIYIVCRILHEYLRRYDRVTWNWKFPSLDEAVNGAENIHCDNSCETNQEQKVGICSFEFEISVVFARFRAYCELRRFIHSRTCDDFFHFITPYH